jgi:citrate lyase beta subunit
VPALSPHDLTEVDTLLADADAALADRYPGDLGGRQPVHTVYVPADRVAPDLARHWGEQALTALQEHAPTAAALADATGVEARLVEDVLPRVLAKLEREPVEDLRIDFEDGYGHRPDEQEDADVAAAVDALSAQAPPYLGIRFKSLERPTRRRGLRTLELFVEGLIDRGGLPRNLQLTLPKVTSADQVQAMAFVCARLEKAHGLGEGRLRFEVQVETPQAVLGADGTATLTRMISAGGGRVSGLHYGTYDYSAALGIAAAHQSMEHPAADHAKAVMQLAAAGTGVRLSDGSTNVLPVGDSAHVHAGWRLHARLVRRSLERGYYQGWDLHPAQLPTRYLATYAFFRQGLPAAGQRLRAYVERSGGAVLDEPATAEALARFLQRGIDCGALTEAEVRVVAGVDTAALGRLLRRVQPST